MQTHAEQQRAREQRLVEEAQRVCQWFPQGSLSVVDRPDVLVYADGDLVGIEVTELVEPKRRGVAPPRPMVSAFQRKVMRRAREIYDTRDGVPLDVVAYFGDEPLNDADTVAKRLVEFVVVHSSDTCETYTGSLPSGFSVVRIMPADVAVGPRWHTNEAGLVPAISRDHLTSVIQDKNGLLPVYREKVNRVWLLIAAPRFPLWQTWSVPREIDQWAFDFDFERVTLLSGEDSRVFDLRRL